MTINKMIKHLVIHLPTKNVRRTYIIISITNPRKKTRPKIQPRHATKSYLSYHRNISHERITKNRQYRGQYPLKTNDDLTLKNLTQIEQYGIDINSTRSISFRKYKAQNPTKKRRISLSTNPCPAFPAWA